jgi:putative secretion ATPase (PEP-CTERM system associated)
MYERFYDLRERPFALSPDPDYLYPSRVHREALDYLRYGLETHAGFVAITGEIGSGKTTLLQTLLRGLDTQTTVARIVNTMLEPRELLETIMIDFGLDPAGRSKPLLLRDLAQYLVDQRLAGRLVLLVIDEAQNLSLSALEELRMLSNLETEKSKLLQILLVGQPNLRDKLSSPDLEQLRQRITVSYHLAPLDAGETASYINHRLGRASIGAPLEFPLEVTSLIHARSRGIPRVINVICDAALVFGYAEERRQIDMPLLRDVLAELETTGVLPAPGRAAGGGLAARPAPSESEYRQVEGPVPSAPEYRRVEGPAPSESEYRQVEGPAPSAPEYRRVEGPVPSESEYRRVEGPEAVESPAAASGSVAPARTSAPVSPTPAPLTTLIAPVAATGPIASRPAASMGTIEGLEGRVAHLDQREQALRQRERELADQRRVLAEEYRLLRPLRPPAPAAAVRVHVPPAARPAVTRFEPARQETVWARFKRFMLELAAPATE